MNTGAITSGCWIEGWGGTRLEGYVDFNLEGWGGD